MILPTRFRRRRLRPFVRLHLQIVPPSSEGESVEPSMEGILVGVFDGHYVLEHARLLTGDGEQALRGRQHVPKERVYWLQELDKVELGEATPA